MSMRLLGKIGLLYVGALVVVPAPAQALEFHGGVSVGGIQIGTEPRLAVSPFAGWLWRSEGDLRLEVHNMLSIVPGAGIGVYDRTAVTLGYATKTTTASLGSSLAIYSMPRGVEEAAGFDPSEDGASSPTVCACSNGVCPPNIPENSHHQDAGVRDVITQDAIAIEPP
ncbi:hypothetical protein [Sorangium sp. So ce128]|uniref:hypothetical protein n=1 Tax=Sorangium sp. So ce128 TaxID=3133281 RepID=UPI003F60B196